MKKIPTPVNCATCRFWQPVDLAPLTIPGAPVVGLCAPKTLRKDIGMHRLPDGRLSRFFEPVVTRPQDRCGAHRSGERLGRWWVDDVGSPTLVPRPAAGTPTEVPQ